MKSKLARMVIFAAVSIWLIIVFGCGNDPVSSKKSLIVENGDSHVIFGSEYDSTIVSFDFGYVPQQSKISHVYWLHNIGADSLEIVSVSPG